MMSRDKLKYKVKGQFLSSYKFILSRDTTFMLCRWLRYTMTAKQGNTAIDVFLVWLPVKYCNILYHFFCIRRAYWAIPENIHTPLWTTLNWVPKNFRISKNDSSSLCRIPNLTHSNSWGIVKFCKSLKGFAGIPIKIHKILDKFMEFQSGSPTSYCRMSNVVHGMSGFFLG